MINVTFSSKSPTLYDAVATVEISHYKSSTVYDEEGTYTEWELWLHILNFFYSEAKEVRLSLSKEQFSSAYEAVCNAIKESPDLLTEIAEGLGESGRHSIIIN